MQSLLVSNQMSRKILALGLPLLVASVASNFAVPTLTFESGSSTITRVDADDGSADGKISFSGALGNFTKVVAFADPTLGDATSPDLNLLSLDVSSAAGGQLIVTFIDDGYTGSPLDLMASIGGTTGAGDSVRYLTYVNNTLLTDSGLLTGAGFDNTKFASLVQGSSYSLKLQAIVTHNSETTPFPQSTSFGARLQTTVPDGGSTAVILGMGLLGLGALRRSRNH